MALLCHGHSSSLLGVALTIHDTVSMLRCSFMSLSPNKRDDKPEKAEADEQAHEADGESRCATRGEGDCEQAEDEKEQHECKGCPPEFW
jgi:hypothetical protein